MQKPLTVNIDEDVYNGLIAAIAPNDINKFVQELLRPYVTQPGLESAYEQLAKDTQREADALEWAEITCKDFTNEKG